MGDQQTITVTVSNLNEGPLITSDGGGTSVALTVAENQTEVTTVLAEDVDSGDGASGAALSYAVDSSGGADQALFKLEASSGVLAFNGGPDFEVMADADRDGVYQLTVVVSDDEGKKKEQRINQKRGGKKKKKKKKKKS